ncbi:MAG: hypothetical protein IIB95_09605, partial [Candidatus Marinimicrobia bacterium]|nr:hypothetical protein [Candidatus Neomarinimicrobiota bacterium]
LKDIKVVTENLRIAANLEPITDDEKLLGVGGESFDNSLDFLNSPEKLNIDAAFNLIEQVTNEFKFEVLQYEEISKKIAENKYEYIDLNKTPIPYSDPLRFTSGNGLARLEVIGDTIINTRIFAKGDEIVGTETHWRKIENEK